jgi:uncharacterized protein (DUF2141 family)
MVVKIAIVFCLLCFLSAEPISIKVNVSGFPSNKGQAYVALFNTTESFPIYGEQLSGKIVQIQDQSCTVSFNNLAKGSYAVAVYHDVNKNKQLDKNLFGMPTERYGFSNNARATFSAPSFNEAKIDCTKDRSINIQVK